MGKNLKSEAVDHLFEAIMTLKDLDEYYAFFEDVCTVNELLSLSQRGMNLFFNLGKIISVPQHQTFVNREIDVLHKIVNLLDSKTVNARLYRKKHVIRFLGYKVIALV